MAEFSGGCHCGNLRLELSLTQAPEAMQVRADQCSFCRAHGGQTVSDPKGYVRVSAARPAEVSRYRFGLKTADFIVCKTCGVYVGAVCETPTGLRAVINANALKDRARFSSMAEPVSYDGENEHERIARREARWTPADIAF
jgi:hypothetical protein